MATRLPLLRCISSISGTDILYWYDSVVRSHRIRMRHSVWRQKQNQAAHHLSADNHSCLPGFREGRWRTAFPWRFIRLLLTERKQRPMDIIFQGLLVVISPIAIVVIITGVFVGIIVGVVPGIGAGVGLSLLLPFIFNIALCRL